MRSVTRVVGGVSRRLGRPELLAVVDANARLAQAEATAMRAVLASALPQGGAYVDVGTNRGQVLAEAVRVAPASEHIAFEPIPALADHIAAAFPGVDCRRKAIGARPEITEFCHFRRLDGWSGLRRSPEISDSDGDPEFIEVEVSTLDEELATVEPRVLKIDVEGAEAGVIEGGRRVLARARPIVIFEHVSDAAALYGAAPGAPYDLLGELGYEIFSVTGAGPFTRERFLAERGTVNWLAAPRG